MADSTFLQKLKIARGGAFFRAFLNPIKALQAAQAIDDSLSFSGFGGAVPIGALVPFTNHITGTPALPANFQLCDGTAITDTNSPMVGQNTPNLNGAADTGRYLRGSDVSGNLQNDATAANGLTFTGNALAPHSHSLLTSGGSTTGGTTAVGNLALASTGSTSAGTPTGTIGSTDAETRPITMTVKWAIRIY